eukprot:1597773-Amphidinium_carterae.1
MEPITRKCLEHHHRVVLALVEEPQLLAESVKGTLHSFALLPLVGACGLSARPRSLGANPRTAPTEQAREEQSWLEATALEAVVFVTV